MTNIEILTDLTKKPEKIFSQLKSQIKSSYPEVFGIKSKYITSTLIGLLALCIVLLVSKFLTERYLEKELAPVAMQSGDDFLALQMQTATALRSLNDLSRDAQQCTQDIQALLVATTKNQRYVYASAVRLDNGTVCTSYGQSLQGELMPGAKQANHYSSSSGMDYWFKASREASSDSGEIIIGQQHAYVWLNKGITISSLTLPAGAALNLLDERTLEPVFTTQSTIWQPPAHRLKSSELVFENNNVYMASPTKIDGLTAVVSVPMSLYMQVLGVYIALCLGLAALMLKVALDLHSRYFSLSAKFRQAISSNTLEVRYQPIVDMNTKQWLGAEALLRCKLNEQSVSPNILITMAQRDGYMRQLTRRVCTKVAQDHASLIWACDDFYITINLSAEDLLDESFPEFTKQLFALYQVPTSRILFEITEESLADKDKAIVQLKKLREQGHQIAIDDFGTGYSSLSYIDILPVDILKIDRSFITPDKLGCVDGLWWHIISLARVHELKVVAEGIETHEQAEILSYAGVTSGQGWLYSKDLCPGSLVRDFFTVEYTGLA